MSRRSEGQIRHTTRTTSQGSTHLQTNYRRFPSHLLCTLLLFPFHVLPSPVHPTEFFFPGFTDIFALFSSNNNNFSSVFRRSLAGFLVLDVRKLAHSCRCCLRHLVSRSSGFRDEFPHFHSKFVGSVLVTDLQTPPHPSKRAVLIFWSK